MLNIGFISKDYFSYKKEADPLVRNSQKESASLLFILVSYYSSIIDFSQIFLGLLISSQKVNNV